MTPIKAVIFDYYETLARLPTDPRRQLFDDLARRLGVDLPPGEAYRHWRELTEKDARLRFGDLERPPLDGARPPFRTFRDVWLVRSGQLFRHWGVDAPPETGADAYAEAHAQAPLYPEVPAVLDHLRRRYRVAVLSDADSDFIEASVRKHKLHLDALVTSEDVRAYKPHVSIFRETCARLGVAPQEAVYVGDSPWADVEGARHAGLLPVWVNRRGAEWPEETEPPQHVVASLEELQVVLE